MSEMRLNDPKGKRALLNAEERVAFVAAVLRQPVRDRPKEFWIGC